MQFNGTEQRAQKYTHTLTVTLWTNVARIYTAENSLFNIRTFSNTIYKNKLKRPKYKISYHKNPRGKHRQNTDINHISTFLDPSPKTKEIKAKIIKLGPIKLKSFCTAKETTDKMKREPIGENIFSNGMTDNELISNIYKQIIQLNLKKKKIKNLVKKLSRTAQSFFKKGNSDGQQAHGEMLNIASHQGNAILQ